MNSLQLALECHKRGLLSKEAMSDVMAVRANMIKKAIAKEASSLFERMGRKVSEGGKGFGGGVLEGLRGGATEAGAAGWGKAVGRLGRLMALGGLAAGALAAGHGMLRSSKEKGLKEDIEKSYQQMFKQNPALNEMDRQKVQRHFGVLARYAPSLAANPTVAGTWVEHSANLGHVDSGMVEQLSKTQAEIDRSGERGALFPSGHFGAIAPAVIKGTVGAG